jgi:hypothetical protein
MALAALCSNVQCPSTRHVFNIGEGSESQDDILARIQTPFKFHAFVVDHDVRPGSHIEAQAVSEVLEQSGILSPPFTNRTSPDALS